MVKNGVALGIALQFVSNIKIPARGKGVLRHKRMFLGSILLFLYLFRRPCNRYPYMVEVILCNVRIVTNHINTPL